MFSNLLHAFVHQVKLRPRAVALIARREDNIVSLTWSELAVLADRVANQLEAEPIGYCSENSLIDLILPLSCMAAGAIEVPLDHRLGAAATKLWDQVGGRWLTSADRESLCSDQDNRRGARSSIDRLTRASRHITANDPALILWTSGTTSTPKGVTLSHQNLLGNAVAKLSAVPQREDDMRLTTLPLSHAYARTCDYGTWLLSGCQLAVGLGFNAWKQLGLVLRPTLCNTVPSIARRLLAAEPGQYGQQRLRLLGCGGAAMSEADFTAWHRRGVTVIQGYGLTETAPVICSATPETAAAGLVGNFVHGWEHEIRDGRLFVRGPHVMLGYWNDQPSTRQRIDPEGWLDTGDLVEVEAGSGQIRILGRADDVIVLSNGHKVHPQSIEQEIESVADVRHAMVIVASEQIEVWIDADDSADTNSMAADIASALSYRPVWERPHQMHRFESPLSTESGELTVKGVVKRQQILKTRSAEFQSKRTAKDVD